MRIHGDLVIKRKSDVEHENDYKNYRSSLAEDFKGICGYCGKTEIVARRGFEIDHFVPLKIDESKKTEYSNLVYSCFTCNRKKSKKWPTNDPNVANDGNVGFVDPADKEFDDHLGRTKDGRIEFYTKVGSYMHHTFKFSSRPITTVWKTMELVRRKEKLRELQKLGKIKDGEKDEYIEIDTAIDDLLRSLGLRGE